MKRNIIKIDENLCNGCGLCVSACHEGAIGLVDGKAKLLRDDYCDGLGNCLPVCPAGAISFEEREATANDEAAVSENMQRKDTQIPCGCPGSDARTITRQTDSCDTFENNRELTSMLNQWPVQIKLVPVTAPYFNGADLLIAADCTAYAFADFHNRFIKNKITLIGCPKLDETDYSDKLTTILKSNDITSVTVIRMEVPCCGGLEQAVKTALIQSGKSIPRHVITISVKGEILKE